MPIGRMDGAVVSGRKRRVFRRVEEKLKVVKLTLEPGARVAGIALAGNNTRFDDNRCHSLQDPALKLGKTPCSAACGHRMDLLWSAF